MKRNLDKLSWAPPPPLPHMLAIAGAHPLIPSSFYAMYFMANQSLLPLDLR